MASDRFRPDEHQPPTTEGNPIEPFTAGLSALLEVPALTESLRRAVEVANAMGPAGWRRGTLSTCENLNETELAYLERVSLKTVQRWRTQGTGPEYRCEAGILYPIRWLMEWRARGRQRMTAQKKTRGRRE